MSTYNIIVETVVSYSIKIFLKNSLTRKQKYDTIALTNQTKESGQMFNEEIERIEREFDRYFCEYSTDEELASLVGVL